MILYLTFLRPQVSLYQSIIVSKFSMQIPQKYVKQYPKNL